MPINWNLEASSLTNIARNNFRELGQKMNETHSFTIAATKIESVGIGDFNQHYDLLHIPNIGGYGFPLNATSNCNNIICGIIGIDEIIYGPEVLVGKKIAWKVYEPIIKKQLDYWKKYNKKIKTFHVATTSEYEEMHRYLGIPYENIKIIPLGVNHDFFQPSKNKELTRSQILSELKIPNEKYFLHVSEYNFERKNQQRILDAFTMARKSGLKHNLVFVGKQFPKFKQIIKKTPGVYVLDWIPDEQLLQIFQGADTLLLPSLHEGFGIPLVEAMSCGVPCITSNTHSPPHVVSDTGIQIDPRDTYEICNAMLKISNDSDLLENLSKKSLIRSKSFSWEKYGVQILELYDIDISKPMLNFDQNYDLAGYRTLVTVCDTFPDKNHPLLLSLIKLDYSKLLQWANDYGLDNPKSRDFLIPFEKWIQRKLEVVM